MHFVPWFVIYKPKPRFISACVDINARLRPPPYFRLPNWGKIFPSLVKGHWALKIDLKHAYFHLALSPELRRFFNFQIGSNVLQCDSACFGLRYIPYYWTQLMKMFSKKWRALGIVVFIYLDDIIISGLSSRYLLRVRPLVLRDLEASGVTINFPKSVLEPSQVIDALGFVVDFTAGELLVPACKRKGYRKEAGKVLKSHFMTPRKMAATLGHSRSLPPLRAFTDLQFVRRVDNVGWDTPCVVPIQLKNQLRAITNFATLQARSQVCDKQPATPKTFTLRRYNVCMGRSQRARPPTSGARNLIFHRAHHRQGINSRVSTTQSLAKPNGIVASDVDNATVYSYLTNQGGKVPRLNNILRPFLI